MNSQGKNKTRDKINTSLDTITVKVIDGAVYVKTKSIHRERWLGCFKSDNDGKIYFDLIHPYRFDFPKQLMEVAFVMDFVLDLVQESRDGSSE